MGTISIPFKFDVSGIDPYVGGGAPLPTGFYLLAIDTMEVKENGGKNGHNLAIVNTVQHGEHKGKKVFDNLNLWIQGNSAAEEIAYKQLSSYGHAVGVTAGEDLGQLANIPYIAEVELVPEQPEKENPNTGEKIPGRKAQNRVLRRMPATEENFNQYIAGGSAVVPAAAAPSPAAAAASSAPAFNPAQNAAPAAAPAPTPSAAPAAATPSAAPTGGAPATPPWLKK